MGYERYPRGTDPQGDYYNRDETQDYGQDYGSGRQHSYSSARDYQGAGRLNRDGDRDRGERGRDQDRYGVPSSSASRSDSQRDYGQRDYGHAGYARDYNRERDDGRSNDRGRNDARSSRYGASGGSEYHGSYGSDGRRFVDVGDRRHWDDDNDDRNRMQGRNDDRSRFGRDDRNRDGRATQGDDHHDRGFLARAGDEVRSWFGDEDAERRRDADNRYDEREYSQRDRHHRDSDYHHWRSGQIAALDRDYDEYRNENRTKFHNEFSSWRTARQTQRDSLGKVQEHAEVVGSDGSHVGTVDKVRGDRILLTRNDVDAGGQHHSIPSSWIASVADKVTLSKTADEAKRHWRDEENKQAMFGDRDSASDNVARQRSTGSSAATGSSQSSSDGRASSTASSSSNGDTNLNSSFSGTYQNK